MDHRLKLSRQHIQHVTNGVKTGTIRIIPHGVNGLEMYRPGELIQFGLGMSCVVRKITEVYDSATLAEIVEEWSGRTMPERTPSDALTVYETEHFAYPHAGRRFAVILW